MNYGGGVLTEQGLYRQSIHVIYPYVYDEVQARRKVDVSPPYSLFRVKYTYNETMCKASWY